MPSDCCIQSIRICSSSNFVCRGSIVCRYREIIWAGCKLLANEARSANCYFIAPFTLHDTPSLLFMLTCFLLTHYPRTTQKQINPIILYGSTFPNYDACAVKKLPSRRMGQRATLCVLHGYSLRITLFAGHRYVKQNMSHHMNIDWKDKNAQLTSDPAQLIAALGP